jgi:hypothetical protein
VLLVQALIISTVLLFLYFYLPRLERSKTAAAVADREARIQHYFESISVQELGREVETEGGTRAHPQQLRTTPTVDEVEQALGAPQARSTDVEGGLHLTWIGDSHRLTASFNHGRLYSLNDEDQHTGHGVVVFESSLYWHTY